MFSDTLHCIKESEGSRESGFQDIAGGVASMRRWSLPEVETVNWWKMGTG